MQIRGVLFDFSGTLFHLEPDIDGVPLDRARLVDTLTSPSAHEHLPAELIDDWERRDLDPEGHRAIYREILRAAHPGIADDTIESVYELVLRPEYWAPYPDTLAALRGLKRAGIPVGVISNIAWNIQSVFEHVGAGTLVDTYVLSFEEGVMKPDPKIFLSACERLGVAPEHTLMIGDNEDADGGATAIGSRFVKVARVVPGDRPNALVDALAAHDLRITGYEQ